MKNTFHVGRRWNIDAWSWSKNADGKNVAHGSRIMRFPKSFDIRSPGYSKSMKHVIEEDWYDVYPYSLVLWPHHFAENFRSGNWWIKRNNYSGLVMELVMEGNVVYECQRKKYVLGAGDLFLTYPGDNLMDVAARSVGQFASITQQQANKLSMFKQLAKSGSISVGQVLHVTKTRVQVADDTYINF